SRFVIGVCNGVALLGAAGLLHGKTVASNFAAEALLRDLGAKEVLPSGAGVAEDGNLFTAGPGIGSFEVALRVMEAAFGRGMAEFVEFAIEYDPHPPYGRATVDKADPEVVQQCRGLLSTIIEQYRKTPSELSRRPD
ncbi:MAG: glutamine amidotransferase, partial [Xanthomonas perforans]|nr:glutamine amidotransferase [Xanthomonas perforans]